MSPGQMPEFEKRLAALNKKASAFGLPALRVLDQQDAFFSRRAETQGRDGDSTLHFLVPARPGDTSVVALVRLRLEFPIVKLGSWQVVGKLDALAGGNAMFCVTDLPGDREAMEERSRSAITCEHCNKKRARKESFLLRDNSSGAYLQVGKACLGDFTGVDPAVALFLAQMSCVVSWADGETDEFMRSGRCNTVNTAEFLAAVSFCIARDGFVSSRLARECGMEPTFASALGLSDACRKSRDLSGSYREQHEEHRACAQETMAWYAAKTDTRDFDRNVQLLLAGERLSLDSKHLAIAAAGVSSFMSRPLDLGLPPGTEHLGTVGQFMECPLTVQRVMARNSPFGLSHMVSLRDPRGNCVIWNASSCPQEIVRGGLGRSLQARFKVKQHGQYQGELQTSVSHLKVQGWLDAGQESATAKTQA